MQGAKKERPLINKKEATPKHKGLKKERHPMKKRDNPKTQGAQTKDRRWKKRQP
jgi:hypothetical protein